MAVERIPFISPEEYLERERKAEFKSEYYGGQIYAMAGASMEHVRICGNIFAELHIALRPRPCEVFANDLRLCTDPDGLYTYPDLLVVCGQPLLTDSHMDTVTNPTLIIEVLSDSTEKYDRGAKFAHYRQIESLSEYVLVSQHAPIVEQYVRQDNGKWLYSSITGLEASVEFPSISCMLELAEIYLRVEFPATNTQTPEGTEPPNG